MVKNKSLLKSVAIVLSFSLISEILFPTVAFALTGGPSQPEVQSFEPVGTNQMVDPFTGDFTYNIPLLDVGGYPVNISYHSGVTMDQEASWVGLGWNINPGVINRNMRGLPDDFSGDEIESEFNMKENRTFSVSSNAGVEIFGADLVGQALGLDVSLGWGINYNTYEGLGFDMSAGANLSLDLNKSSTESGTAGLGLNFVSGSNDGLSINPSVSFSQNMGDKLNGLGLGGLTTTVGASFNSREGVKGYSVGVQSYSRTDDPLNAVRRFFGLTQVKQKKGQGGGISLGSSMSLMPNTYVPQQKFPFISVNTGASFKLGATVFGVEGTFDIAGSYGVQRLLTKKKSSPAYGYLYSEQGIGDEKSMLDFNREKERVFTQHTTNLPVTNFTYDLYGISGQGIGGMFRSHRSDVGYVRDPEVRNVSGSGNFGLEIASGQAVKGGVDIRANAVNSVSGMWNEDNAAKSLEFSGAPKGQIRETSYFKMVGEKNTNSLDVKNGPKTDWWKMALLGSTPVQVSLEGDGTSVKAASKFKKSDESEVSFSTIERGNRAKRQQFVSSTTHDELDNFDYYAGRTHIANLISTRPEVEDNIGKHIGQIKVVKPDGARYIYGLPAYNYFSKDVTFNISGKAGKDCNKGLISYNDDDASVENSRGKDQFYQNTKTPAYAHSYLLTEVLSPDYSDFDNVPGPSGGDLGNYVKFEYTTVPNYKWRVPVESYKAVYNEGLKSLASDDMANYSYGEKELKYLEKIESKTHVAIFHTSNRSDGRGVKGETGGVNSSSASMKQLDKITLYTKAEYEEYSQNLSAATPIKEVHFEYSYDLCPGIPNNGNNGGKLTLRKMYFTYGKSFRAKLNSYEFSYGDLDHDGFEDASANPSYNLKGYDRWGSYNPNNGGCGINDPIAAYEYPYTPQDSNLVNTYKAAWNLTDILLPSGGKLEIDYESDDYAYVQDRRAMQMFQVLGAADEIAEFNPASPSNVLYNGKDPNEYLFIATPEATSTDKNTLIEKYFNGLVGRFMQFKFLMNLTNKAQDYHYDYINGYCKVIDVGFVPGIGTGHDYAYIQIDNVRNGDPQNTSANANPISVATWNFMRKYNSELAYSVKPNNNATAPGVPNLEDLFVEILDATKSLGDFIAGANGALRIRDFGRKFVTGKSWVRLTNPTFRKFGGDVRVKRIKIKDSWDQMTVDGYESEYGQEYSYRLENGKSSGVAAYEPLIGGDENPFRQPVFFTESRMLAPNDEFFMEEPFGESFFPAPSVGYSRVVVRNLQHKNIVKNQTTRQVTKHATGKTIHEFFTAKDYPTIVKQTSLDVKHKVPSFLSKMLKFSVRDYMYTSQGYMIEKNDMHGKPKAQWVYAEGESSYQSGVQYEYSTTGGRLNNKIPVLFKDNTVSSDLELGVEYDLVNDFRHSKTESYSSGMNTNIDVFLAGIFPIPVPLILGAYNKSTNQYRSVATTKVVNRFGIQTKTTAYNNKSKIETENLLWDSETGDVLLTKVNNQYNDAVYSFNYPAHMAYEGMEGAYKNEGFEMNSVSLDWEEPFIDESNSNFQYFTEGDQVYLQGPEMMAWVIKGVKSDPNGVDPDLLGYYLIDKDGNAIPGRSSTLDYESKHAELNSSTTSLKIVRSGHRNMQGLSIGNILLKENPIVRNPNTLKDELNLVSNNLPVNSVIAASANEYSDQWQGDVYPVVSDYQVLTTKSYTYHANLPVIKESGDLMKYIVNKLVSDNYCDGTNKTFDPSQLTSFLSNYNISHTQSPSVEYFIRKYAKWESGHDYTDSFYNNYTLKMDLYAGTGAYNTTGSCLLVFKMYKPSGLFFDEVSFWFYANKLPGTTTTNPVGTLTAVNDIVVEPCTYQDGDVYKPTDYGTKRGMRFEKLRFESVSYPDLIGGADDFPFYGFTPTVQEKGVPGPTNPYTKGIRGNWYPKASWAPLQNRNYQTLYTLRQDGLMDDFYPFWKEGTGDYLTRDDLGWSNASVVTKYDGHGNEVENRDALGNYSSALYGYSGSLPKAVAQNAQWGQIAFDGFEDHFYPSVERLNGEYFELYEDFDASTDIVEDCAHSGRYSLKIEPTPVGGKKLFENEDANFNDAQSGCSDDGQPNLFVNSDCDGLNSFGQFSIAGTTQVFITTYWVKEAGSSSTDATKFSVNIGRNGFVPSLTDVKYSEPIEGWVKVEAKVEVNLQPTDNLSVVVENNSSNNFYLDDLRIQPVNSSMKSFVYHPNTLRLAAQLDENNYATFYEYDEEGNLVRVKKETERGIQTISEHRQNLAKN